MIQVQSQIQILMHVAFNFNFAVEEYTDTLTINTLARIILLFSQDFIAHFVWRKMVMNCYGITHSRQKSVENMQIVIITVPVDC